MPPPTNGGPPPPPFDIAAPPPAIKPTPSAIRRARVRGVNAGLHFSLCGGRLAVGACGALDGMGEERGDRAANSPCAQPARRTTPAQRLGGHAGAGRGRTLARTQSRAGARTHRARALLRKTQPLTPPGPDWKSALGSLLLFAAPAAVFFALVAPRIPLWQALVTAAVTAVSLGSFFATALADPGFIPRSLEDDPAHAAEIGWRPPAREQEINGYIVTTKVNE